MTDFGERPPEISQEVAKAARTLRTEELVSAAEEQFAQQIANGELTREQVDQFVSEKVTGAKVNGVDVVSIDFEHKDVEVDPMMEAYIRSPRTKMVGAEYFYPELARNAERVHLSRFMKSVETDGRFEQAQRIAEICRDAGKPVAVADIANKASYMVLREAFRYVPGFTAFVGAAASGDLRLMAPFIANIGWVYAMNSQMSDGKGIFDKNRIATFEKLALDFEDARRLYLAKGVEQLTHEYPPLPQSGDEGSQIVVLYPKAHGMRMVDAIVNPKPAIAKAKNLVYRAFGPGLDYSVRTWAWRDASQQLADSGYQWGKYTGRDAQQMPHAGQTQNQVQHRDNWTLVSNRKIAA